MPLSPLKETDDRQLNQKENQQDHTVSINRKGHKADTVFFGTPLLLQTGHMAADCITPGLFSCRLSKQAAEYIPCQKGHHRAKGRIPHPGKSGQCSKQQCDYETKYSTAYRSFVIGLFRKHG